MDNPDTTDMPNIPDALPEDNDTPFSVPDDVENSLAADHPATDSNVDEHETYDEGLSGAAEAEDL